VAKAVRVRVPLWAPFVQPSRCLRRGASLGRVGYDAKAWLTVLTGYFPILMFLVVAASVGVSLLLAGHFLGPRRPDSEKLSPYECGFEAFEDARMKFDVRYYLIAILFIIFDLEIAFLFPWAVVYQELGLTSIISMTVFLGILVVGFAYEWKKGALDWE
jgi:NADH-quinone oxidoreductase subunit A